MVKSAETKIGAHHINFSNKNRHYEATVTFNLAAGKYQVDTDKIALHTFAQSFDDARRQLFGVVLHFSLCHQLKHDRLFFFRHAGGQFVAAHAIPVHVPNVIASKPAASLRCWRTISILFRVALASAALVCFATMIVAMPVSQLMQE